jgi:hypothetical protein
MKLKQIHSNKLLFSVIGLAIITSSIAQEASSSKQNHPDLAKHRIKGIVTVWKSKTPIKGVLVATAGTTTQKDAIGGFNTITNGVGVETDSSGSFELYLPDSMIGKKITLVILKKNYVSKEVIVKTWKLPAKLDIKMEAEYSCPGGVRFL